MPNIVVAGATGFIGKKLVEKLSHNPENKIIALSRSITGKINTENIEWRACDVFSLLDIEKALEGANYAYYLIHSMLPSAKLSQGSFQDFDLILADNFARAAKSKGVKQIIYLGGLIPDVDQLSIHLESRLEVEKSLAEYGTPLTSLRAGLIVGKEGSSFTILTRLIQRLPVLVCPAWTSTLCTPTELNDVVHALHFCLGKDHTFNQQYDLGGDEVISYKNMLKQTAKTLHKKRFFLSVPYFSFHWSKWWVTLVTGAPRNLVYPLVSSLKHSMVRKKENALKLPEFQWKKFSDSLTNAIDNKERFTIEKQPLAFRGQFRFFEAEDVRSVQRLPLPKDKDAPWVAKEYIRWLPRFLNPLIKVVVKENQIFFCFLFRWLVLLELHLSSERSSDSRRLFYIRGGLLAAETKRGRLEFREALHGSCILAAIHEFKPALPWFIYRYTQAVFHLLVMNSFHKHLSKY